MHKSIGTYAIIYMLLTEARNGGTVFAWRYSLYFL